MFVYQNYFKFFIFIFLWFYSDFAIFKDNQLLDQKNDYENKIVELNNTIKNFENDQNRYCNTLKDIVVNLYEKEEFGIGGLDNPHKENMDTIIKSINNFTIDYDSMINNINLFFNERQEVLNSIPSIFPIKYTKNARITSPFGMRYNPVTGNFSFHKGVDITAEENTPIVATADGIVKDVWIYHEFWGKMIGISHANGFQTKYYHMNKTIVMEGWEVKQGDIIGYLGNTGMSTGPHVHYEVLQYGENKNPIKYLNMRSIINM